jgi:hypothetical protein
MLDLFGLKKAARKVSLLTATVLACALLASPAMAQKIGDRIDKVGERVTKRTEQKINSKVNQRVSKVNSKIDRTIDKTIDNALDPKSYKRKKKAAKKEAKKAARDEKQKQKAIRKAEKAGYIYTPPTPEKTAEERAKANASNEQRYLSTIPKSSYYNSFVGSMELEAQYYSPKSNDGGDADLMAIKDKFYTISVFARPSMTTIQTRGAGGEYGYTTAYEEDVRVYEDSLGRVVSDTSRYCRFVYVDFQKKEYISKPLQDVSKLSEEMPMKKELVASRYFVYGNDSVNCTRYWGEDNLYKIELWADDSRSQTAIHTFNTIFGISNERPDLLPTFAINMMRVPVYYARIVHKNTKEVLIIKLKNISSARPDKAYFQEPSNVNFTKLDDEKAVPRVKNPNNPTSTTSTEPPVKDADVKKID